VKKLTLALLLVSAAAAAQPDPTPARGHQGAPANGVDEHPRRGTYVETSLGFFTAMGGSAGVSNAQAYLGVTLGHEIGDQAAIFASLGIGATSASCYLLGSNGNCMAADSFAATFVEGGASYGVPLGLRALLSLKVVAGFTDLSPGPVQTTSGNVPDHVPGFHFGGGLSLDYDTHLDHFAVGIDTLLRYTMARYQMTMPSLAVMPRIRYVF
jgi:hypothetical protein